MSTIILVGVGLKDSLLSFLCADMFTKLDDELDILNNLSSSSSSHVKESAVGKIP